MHEARARSGFTLIELLVALIAMGVAGAGLASALTGDRRMRDLAAGLAFAADRARERIESLAALTCVPSAAGSSSSAWGSERWTAAASGVTWRVTDSLTLRGSSAPIVIAARIACPE